MKEPIIIPRTLNSLVRSLGGIDSLLTAKEWERAVYVHTWTVKGRPGPGDRAGTDAISIREFARLGIKGLSREETVRIYRATWQAAIDAGIAEEARPGQKVILPDADWKDYFQGDQTRYVAKTPAAIQRVLREDPSLAEAAATVVPILPAARAAIAREVLSNEDTATEVMRDPATRERAVRGTTRAINEEMDERNPHRRTPAYRADRTQQRETPPTNVMTGPALSLGVEVAINDARRAVRSAAGLIESSYAKLDADAKGSFDEDIQGLEADIEMLKAVIHNEVDDQELADFLRGDL